MGILSLFPCSFADGSNLLLYFNATIISRLFVLFIGVFQTRFLCISKRRCLRSLRLPPFSFSSLSLSAFPLSYCSRFFLLFTELPPHLMFASSLLIYIICFQRGFFFI
jgi:hypothetical protein